MADSPNSSVSVGCVSGQKYPAKAKIIIFPRNAPIIMAKMVGYGGQINKSIMAENCYNEFTQQQLRGKFP
jgi:hypothetical protein